MIYSYSNKIEREKTHKNIQIQKHKEASSQLSINGLIEREKLSAASCVSLLYLCVCALKIYRLDRLYGSLSL